MGKTEIEWATDVWNPVTGCTKVSQGCKNCYAERIFERFNKDRKFTDVRCHPERLEQPLHWKKPRRIFVNSMSDLFHEDVPEEFIAAIVGICAVTSQHAYMILTKRADRMLSVMAKTNYLRCFSAMEKYGIAEKKGRWVDPKFWHWPRVWPPPNVWLGVSVEDQKTADERIPLLLQTPAAVRFVSYEPAMAAVDFVRWMDITYAGNGFQPAKGRAAYGEQRPKINWVIAGGESGPHARPAHPDWFRAVRDQCQAAGVPFFFKQWGEWLPEDHMPERHLWMRQDYQETGPNVRLVEYEKGPAVKYPSIPMFRVGKKAAGRLLDGRDAQLEGALL